MLQFLRHPWVEPAVLAFAAIAVVATYLLVVRDIERIYGRGATVIDVFVDMLRLR